MNDSVIVDYSTLHRCMSMALVGRNKDAELMLFDHLLTTPLYTNLYDRADIHAAAGEIMAQLRWKMKHYAGLN